MLVFKLTQRNINKGCCHFVNKPTVINIWCIWEWRLMHRIWIRNVALIVIFFYYNLTDIIDMAMISTYQTIIMHGCIFTCKFFTKLKCIIDAAITQNTRFIRHCSNYAPNNLVNNTFETYSLPCKNYTVYFVSNNSKEYLMLETLKMQQLQKKRGLYCLLWLFDCLEALIYCLIWMNEFVLSIF